LPEAFIDIGWTAAAGASVGASTADRQEKAKAAFNSQAYKDAKRVGDKYAKFRIYAVEGLSQ
jgi:hypothetical protein